MQNFNHVAGGFAFTGLFCSFADVNVFERFDTMAVVWVAAILPDIDHTKSIIGRTFYPLAKWIQTKYGHRTITHSIFFYIAVVCIVKGIDNLWHLHFTLPVALALGSHLIFDMCTKQGIPIFYPFSRKVAVLPANPNLRLAASDFRSEAIIFVVFCGLNVFSYPLMAQGFWARYNQGFATFDHLSREVKRKPGDYDVTVLSNERDTTVGLLVEQKAEEIVLFDKGKFLRFATDKVKLMNFLRRKNRHQFKTINLLQVNCDSLNQYMKLPVVKIIAQSEQELFYFEGPIMKKGNELSADYPNGARFQQLAIDNAQTEFELAELGLQQRAAELTYHSKLSQLEKYRADLYKHSQSTNLSDYEEGKRREKIKELTEKIALFELPEPVNVAMYRVQRQMLEHKLRETAHLNATLLIWEAQKNQN